MLVVGVGRQIFLGGASLLDAFFLREQSVAQNFLWNNYLAQKSTILPKKIKQDETGSFGIVCLLRQLEGFCSDGAGGNRPVPKALQNCCNHTPRLGNTLC